MRIISITTCRIIFPVEPEYVLPDRWCEKMENAERAKVKTAAMTVSLSVYGLNLKDSLRTSDGECAINVVPPSSVYTTPADED